MSAAVFLDADRKAALEAWLTTQAGARRVTVLDEARLSGGDQRGGGHRQGGLRRLARTHPTQRSALLGRLADLIRDHAAEFARLNTLEIGTPLTIAAGGPRRPFPPTN